MTAVAGEAIVQLLRILERRWESRRRSASLDDDFRRLADWFAAVPDEEEAHRLFQAAFGIWPARHAHLLPEDHEAVPSTASWTETPPVLVSPTLRSSGAEGPRGGRSRAVGDPGPLRAQRQRDQAEALARRGDVRLALVTNGSVPLSTFGRLEPDEFAELLDLLNQALTAPRSSDQSRRSLSVDGQVEIVIVKLLPARWPACARKTVN